MRLFVDFAFGAVAWTFRDRIPMNDRLGVVMSVALVVSFPLGLYRLVGSLLLTYVALWVACRLPIRSFDRRGDLSYGTYLYAFPIQQLLVVAGATAFGPIPFILVASATVLPFAGLSWLLIEGPALRLKSWQPSATALSRARLVGLAARPWGRPRAVAEAPAVPLEGARADPAPPPAPDPGADPWPRRPRPLN